MDMIQKLTEELEVKKWQVEAAVRLIDEGNTIPFIARYRKEATGSLNDEQLRSLHERLIYLRNLEEKKEQVLASIEEQGKLTERTESADYKCPDACCCGRSVPTISAKKADKGDHCKGERTGTAGDTSDAAKDTKAFWEEEAQKIYFCRKRSTYSGRGHCRCKRHPCGDSF